LVALSSKARLLRPVAHLGMLRALFALPALRKMCAAQLIS
jgi:hypothetical protein